MVSKDTSPLDINKATIAPYQAEVESKFFMKYQYEGDRNLADLVKQIDKTEPNLMTPLETNTYIALREGMQIFKAATEMVGKKIGLPAKISSNSPDKGQAREFCYGFAAFAASTYIMRKVDALIKADGDLDASHDKPDLSFMKLETNNPEEVVMKNMLAPVYGGLVKHLATQEVFKTPYELPIFVKEVFEKYSELAKQIKGKYPELEKNFQGYTFRIMDNFVSLQGFEDKSIETLSASSQPKVSFRPIKDEDITGNMSAKEQIRRFSERLCLYDPVAKNNPFMDLGGLAWTILFDGIPGTGKSSLFRRGMTIVDERCGQIGLKYHIFVIDQSLKREFYGQTGQITLERIGVTKDDQAVSLGIFDDLDLLTSTRDNAQGADNDINNIIMQYFDGAFTLRLGNVINFGASNKPTGLDDALRNRFWNRMLVDGPVIAEDFADIINLELKGMLKNGKLQMTQGYTPFATQNMKFFQEQKRLQSEQMAEELQRRKHATVYEFGQFMADLKAKNNKISGRSAKAITDAIKARSADFDIPDTWFTNRAEFIEQPFDKKKKMASELYTTITADVLFEEAQRYFDSEERYARNDESEAVGSGYNNMMWNMQSEIKALEEQVARGDNSEIARLHILRQQVGLIQEKANDTVRKLVGDKLEQRR